MERAPINTTITTGASAVTKYASPPAGLVKAQLMGGNVTNNATLVAATVDVYKGSTKIATATYTASSNTAGTVKPFVLSTTSSAHLTKWSTTDAVKIVASADGNSVPLDVNLIFDGTNSPH